MREIGIEADPVLFGADSTEGIVAVDAAGDTKVRITRRVDGRILVEEDELRPFLLLADEKALDGARVGFEVQRLEGDGELRVRATFGGWKDLLSARNFAEKRTGARPSDPGAPYLFLGDPVHQYLLRTGKTFFKGLQFQKLNRLSLDIETLTAPGFEFSNAERPDDRIVSVAVAGSDGFEKVLLATGLTETEILQKLCQIIRERDPDVIEGHNLFRFDLPYLATRARLNHVKLDWGRDASAPVTHPSRILVAERTIDYPRADIVGRSVLDTWILAQFYDVSSRELQSTGLKDVARHLGVAAPDRTYVDAGSINEIFRTDPERLARYNLDDVRETRSLGELLGMSYFIQGRIFPYSFQTGIVRGNATKINALFLREYLRRGQAIPRLRGYGRADESAPEELEGGYVAIFEEGIARGVLHCDVRSLYPSLMLVYGLKPGGDSLAIFLPLLANLRSFRLKAKDAMKAAHVEPERRYYEALQSTFKVLINSFYGYLGTTIHNFSDATVAAEVTAKGRTLIQEMIGGLKEMGCRPIEIDTDGIYFVPPGGEAGMGAGERIVRNLAQGLPSGIEIELAGRYPAMFSYKAKNYALLDPKGRVILRGSGLRSRGIERYLREFLRGMIALALAGRAGEIEALYRETTKKIEDHSLPIAWLGRTETLSESVESYQAKVKARKRNRSAAYEIAARGEREYRAGDQISYYVTGVGKNVRAYDNCRPVAAWNPAHPDENVDAYVDKLHQLYEKFRPYVVDAHPVEAG